MDEKSIKTNNIEKIQTNIIVQYPANYIWVRKIGSVIC